MFFCSWLYHAAVPELILKQFKRILKESSIRISITCPYDFILLRLAVLFCISKSNKFYQWARHLSSDSNVSPTLTYCVGSCSAYFLFLIYSLKLANYVFELWFLYWIMICIKINKFFITIYSMSHWVGIIWKTFLTFNLAKKWFVNGCNCIIKFSF